MWRKGICLALLMFASVQVQANVASTTSSLNLKLLAPLLIETAEEISDAKKDKKVSYDDLFNNSRQVPTKRYHQIKQYIKSFKKYSKLQVTNQLAITVGTVKSAPLGADSQSLVETRDIFLPRMHNLEESSAKGYGLKFNFDL